MPLENSIYYIGVTEKKDEREKKKVREGHKWNILMIFINLLNTTIFDNKYSGITMYISSVIFTIGSAFFINAKRL